MGTRFPVRQLELSPFGDASLFEDTQPFDSVAITISQRRFWTVATFWPLACDISLPRSSSIALGFMERFLGASLGRLMTS